MGFVEMILKKLINGIFEGIGTILGFIKDFVMGLFELDFLKIWDAIIVFLGKIGQFFLFLKNLFIVIVTFLGGGVRAIGTAIFIVLVILIIAFIVVKRKARKATMGLIGSTRGVSRWKAKRLAKKYAKKQLKKETKKINKKNKKIAIKMKSQGEVKTKQMLYDIGEMAKEESDSRWLSDTERNECFASVKFSDLKKSGNSGIPVYAFYDEKKKDVMINLKQPEHSLIVGSTGSGKTTMIVNPTIQVLGHSGSRSSMICYDPKGELYSGHSDMLRAAGYDVVLLNLDNPIQSGKWNPLGDVSSVYYEYVRAGSEIFERTDDVYASGLKLSNDAGVYGNVWYEYKGVAYPDARSTLKEADKVRNELFEEVYRILVTVISSLFMLEEDEDVESIERGAMRLTVAVALSILEDTTHLTGRSNKPLTFAAIYKAIEDSYESGGTIKEFFEKRPDHSVAKKHANSLCALSEDKLVDYVSKAHMALAVFDDNSIRQMTSKSDVSTVLFANRPTAIFIKTPDDNIQRRTLGSVFILCLYRALKKQADSSENLQLPRDVYFILDEFGSCPRISDFDTMITSGRSRRIYFELVIQSFAQLSNVYGEQIAHIVKSNCPTKICLGSSETETCEEFSRICGTVMTEKSELTKSSTSGDAQMSTHFEKQPLISVAELTRLNSATDDGNAIVTGLGHYPIKAKMTPSYKCPKYEMGAIAAFITAAVIFASAFIFGNVPVSAASIDYSGELSSDTLSPVESEEGKEQSKAHVKIKKGIYYDEEKEEFVYSVQGGEGILRSSVLDGMIVTDKVSITCDKNVDAAIYLDGLKLKEPDLSNISDKGEYSVEVTCAGKKEILFSFTIIGEVSGKYKVFTVPSGLRITGAKRDGKDIEYTKTTVDMSTEGVYLILYGKKRLSKRFMLDVKTDFTPPNVILKGVDGKGVARGSVTIEGINPEDEVVVTREGEPYSPGSNMTLKDNGIYVVTVTDPAGNSSRHEFTIMSFFDVGIYGFLVVITATIVIVAVYLIRERKRFRVR
ncbi:MAG: type IV secretory system conjugative DNA transfer family protein [Lachnospiraceae bacterium]|nr:type IV secretory system conjugative DNA transfer family protein [Lachnospiraceae bacterium]